MSIETLLPERKQLTPKQRKFFRYLLSGAQPTDAAMLSFDCKDRKVARVRASQTLSLFNIRMPDLMEQMGLTDERDIQDLIKLRNAKITKFFSHEGEVTDKRIINDNSTQIRALELTLRVKGHLKEATINNDNSSSFTLIQQMRVALNERKQSQETQQPGAPSDP